MSSRAVEIDRPRCRGHGVCALLAPDFFTVADDGVAVVRRQPADPGEVEVVDDAVADCPAHAIGWVAERAGHA